MMYDGRRFCKATSNVVRLVGARLSVRLQPERGEGDSNGFRSLENYPKPSTLSPKLSSPFFALGHLV